MALLYLITFLSGVAALIYQVLWIRELALVLGSTTASICTVVAAFMGGLALGSAVIGRWVDRRSRFLLVYAALEVGIGVTALALEFVFPWTLSLYPRLAIAASGSIWMLTALRFVVAFALLLLPTSLMGGTFPVLVKALTREVGHLGANISRLYAANTFGAVVGCFVAGIWMIGALGLPGTYAIAVGLNLVAALGAWALQISPLSRAASPPVHGAAPPSLRSTPLDGSTRAVLLAIGVSGSIALGYEIVWSRALAIVLGHSIYAFTFVLCTYLAGLALGGALVAARLDRWKDPARAFALGLLALAIVSAASLFLIPFLEFQNYTFRLSPLEYVARNLTCATALLLFPTVILGALLPLAIRACSGSLERAGADVGRVYAWNTLGSIAGSLLTGFVLIPWLGTQRSFVFLVLANLALALAVGLRARWSPRWTLVSAALLVLAAVEFSLSADSPILRDKAIERVEAQLGAKVELRYWGEDQVVSVGLIRGSDGLERLFTNGVLMTHWGQETLWMAHLPLAMVEAPRDVLVLCLGMGNTYRAAALHPVSVTAVELSPKVVEAFYVMHGKSPSAASDDRIEVGDARNAVLVSERQFDVITIDPPPPLYSAGTVSFHTLEFFQLLRARLRPKGVVCEWIPFRECTEDEFKSIVRGFATVFERASMWIPSASAGISGVYLIGPGAEAVIDPAAVRARLISPLVESDVRQFSSEPLDGLLPLAAMDDEQIRKYCGNADLLDDAHPFLEFPLFRNRRNKTVMDQAALLGYLRANGLVR